jgi:hypothetical protein
LWTCLEFNSPQVSRKLWTFRPDPQYIRLLWTYQKLCGNVRRALKCSRTPLVTDLKRRFTRNCSSCLPRGVYWIRPDFDCLCRGAPTKGPRKRISLKLTQNPPPEEGSTWDYPNVPEECGNTGRSPRLPGKPRLPAGGHVLLPIPRLDLS